MKDADLEHLDNSLQNSIDKYYESKEETPRLYLGGSEIGHWCPRHLWYSWRHALTERHSGRKLRLFQRGYDEEMRVIVWLFNVGYNITCCGDDQLELERHHIKGHPDGVINEEMILEIKTCDLASFRKYISKNPKYEPHFIHNEVSADVLQSSRLLQRAPQHWIQCQIYMGMSGYHKCLYVRVCKDNDFIASEVVEFDESVFNALMVYADALSKMSKAPPPPVAHPEKFYKCKMCQCQAICTKKEPAPNVHCRTCSHASFDKDWRCALHPKRPIPESFQLTGCESHTLMPDMVPWHNDRRDEVHPEKVWVIDGEPVRNGDSDAFTLSSKEILEKHREHK